MRKKYLDVLKESFFDKKVVTEQNKSEIHQKIKDFFMNRPQPPNDKEVHDFASSIEMDEHELENHIYVILTKALTAVGKHNEIPREKFDQKELHMGIEVELEHTDSRIIAENIARDHLAECSKYYSFLLEMEKRCKNTEEK